jgi:FkbM family methyltransferase
MWIKLRGYWFLISLGQAEMDGFLQAWLFAAYEPTSQFVAQPGDVIIDAGANVGFYATRQAARGARVIAFEPNPAAASRLRASLARNRLESLVTVVQAALGSHSERRAFYVNSANSVTSSLFASSGSPSAASEIEIDAVALDDIVLQLGMDRVDVIKLDVEGAEGMALKGATRSLQGVRGVVMEYHSQDLRDLCAAELVRAGLSPLHDDGHYLAFVGNDLNAKR